MAPALPSLGLKKSNPRSKWLRSKWTLPVLGLVAVAVAITVFSDTGKEIIPFVAAEKDFVDYTGAGHGKVRTFLPYPKDDTIYDSAPIDGFEEVFVDGAVLPTDPQGTKAPKLHMRLYHPVDPKTHKPIPDTTERPAILIHSPYYQTVFPGITDHGHDFMVHFTRRGYTVAISDIRGTGQSEGCFDYLGSHDGQDFHILTEYLAKQLWSNGRVGAWGFSIPAGHAANGSTTAPPHLAAVVEVAPLASTYSFLGHSNGVPWEWARSTHAPPADITKTSLVTTPPLPVGSDGLPLFIHRAGCDHSEMMQAATDTSGTETPWYQERDAERRVKNVRAATLFVQGFRDLNVFPEVIRSWFDQLPSGHVMTTTSPSGKTVITTKQVNRAVLGPWAHTIPYENPLIDSAVALTAPHWYQMLDAWFDYYLRGNTPVGYNRDGTFSDLPVSEWPAIQVEDERGYWRAANSVADLGGKTLSLYLAEDEGIAVADDGHPNKKIKKEPPTTGAVAIGESKWTRWVTEPFSESLHLSGSVALDLTVKLREPFTRARFAFELWEDNPAFSRNVTYGFQSAQHSNCNGGGIDNPVDLQPGQTCKYHVLLSPNDINIHKGSQLTLVITGTTTADVQDPNPMHAQHLLLVGPYPLPYASMIPEGNNWVGDVLIGPSAIRLPVVASPQTCLDVDQVQQPTTDQSQDGSVIPLPVGCESLTTPPASRPRGDCPRNDCFKFTDFIFQTPSYCGNLTCDTDLGETSGVCPVDCTTLTAPTL